MASVANAAKTRKITMKTLLKAQLYGVCGLAWGPAEPASPSLWTEQLPVCRSLPETGEGEQTHYLWPFTNKFTKYPINTFSTVLQFTFCLSQLLPEALPQLLLNPNGQGLPRTEGKGTTQQQDWVGLKNGGRKKIDDSEIIFHYSTWT